MEYFWSTVRSPGFHLAAAVLVGTAIIESLVILWAATSRHHWLLRALAVWCAAAILVPIRAYEPALIFAASAAALFLIFATVRRIQAGRQNHVSPEITQSRLRFTLRELLLLMAIVGLWLAVLVPIAKRSPPISWLSVGASVAVITCISSAAYFLAAGSRKLRTAIVLVVALGISELLIVSTVDWRTWEIVGAYIGADMGTHEYVRVAVILAEFALGLLLAIALLYAAFTGGSSRWWRQISRGLLGIGAIAIGIPLAIVYLQMRRLTPLPPPFESSQNNHARIMAIVDEVQRLNPGEASLQDIRAGKAPSQQVESLEAIYAELLSLLEAPNFMPLDPTIDADPTKSNSMSMSRIQTLRSLARSLQAEGKSVAASGDIDRAADCAVANLRLGTMLRRGGTIVEALVGCAITSVANHQINEIRDSAADGDAKRLIAELKRSRLEIEPIESLLERDVAIWERSGGWQAKLQIVLAELQGATTSTNPSDSYNRIEATRALLQTHLALRLYEKDHSQLPTTLAELVPNYLPELPIDAYSGQPLIYRLVDANFMLYSVGDDAIDDGGRFGNWQTYHLEDGYDFDLDTLTRP